MTLELRHKAVAGVEGFFLLDRWPLDTEEKKYY